MGFLLLMFAAIWGSVFLSLEFRKQRNALEDRTAGPSDALREELEMVTGRLARLEEEMDFFRALHAGDDEPAALEPGADPPPAESGPE